MTENSQDLNPISGCAGECLIIIGPTLQLTRLLYQDLLLMCWRRIPQHTFRGPSRVRTDVEAQGEQFYTGAFKGLTICTQRKPEVKE